ncbi:MAG: 50S ribosomal protein L10 [Candidatus Magasanikbacteria bacterium CG10_big_fil_rev_8_21_14_0_10_43_6]|uniref:Large ribosomal subunit protein uL10 n=1 Tax=Candidatus Magasanikbacteria bacterium CG10_big_fil_rev_8_21_14_0_10_43_6 TaxID=1974650 RepID=A0A2M6W1G2_9BACT|nr:MAG: 50S ribosomal protein L10 [Candidatus Magasanikbacteria bacterium CG10_big_fil_rev_8_21_14_0_10_43_6]
MAKTKLQKEEAIQSLVSSLQSAKSAVFANFQGLTVQETEELRAQCREQEITCIATKKTLMTRALTDAGFDVDAKAFNGAVAAFFGNTDEVAPAQIVANFAKTHEIVTIFGGVLEGSFIEAGKVHDLSKLPSKQQLLGQLVGTMQAPVSGFVRVLGGNLRGLVTVLDAVREQKS